MGFGWSQVALRETLDKGLIALGLTYSLTMSGLLQWTIRQSAQSEAFLTAVERLSHYAALESEGARVNPGYRPPGEGWPWQGAVVVKALSCRHREDLPVIVHEASFEIPAGSKVEWGNWRMCNVWMGLD